MECKNDTECNPGEVCVGGVCKKINDSYGLSKFYIIDFSRGINKK